MLKGCQQQGTAVKTYNVVLSHIHGNLVSRMGDPGFLSPWTAHSLGASHPPLTVPFPLGSRPMFKENRLAQYSEAVGLSGTSFYKLHNKVFTNE